MQPSSYGCTREDAKHERNASSNSGFKCLANFSVMFSDKQLEIGQLHTIWRINSGTVLIKEHMGFTVTEYILWAQYELLTL